MRNIYEYELKLFREKNSDLEKNQQSRKAELKIRGAVSGGQGSAELAEDHFETDYFRVHERRQMADMGRFMGHRQTPNIELAQAQKAVGTKAWR